jgi:predicted kinase
MREWMREQMRKRSKRGPNTSESTGKIGQEIPSDQPKPLSPTYPEGRPARLAAAEAAEPEGNETEVPASFEVAGERTEDAVDSGETATPGAAGIASENEIPKHEDDLDAEGPELGGLEPEGRLEVETQPDSPSIPPPEAPATGAKGPRGFVVLTIGLPGSGKTTWFKRRGVLPLSSDMLRSILFDDITEQRYQGLVFSTLRSLLRARLIAKMPWNYVDATNLSPHERRQWIKMAKSFGYDVQAVFFDVPLDVCLERNSRRERVVSAEAMQKMAERLRPPSFKEGFSKITVVRVKGASAAPPDLGAPEA